MTSNFTKQEIATLKEFVANMGSYAIIQKENNSRKKPDDIYIDGKLIVEYTDEDIIIHDGDKKIVMMNKNIGAKKPGLDKDSYGDYFTFDEAQNKAPEGYYVPESREFVRVVDILVRLGVMDNADNGSMLSNVLLLPLAGCYYNRSSEALDKGDNAYYWSSSPYSESARGLYFCPSYVDAYSSNNRADGFSLRCFKDF